MYERISKKSHFGNVLHPLGYTTTGSSISFSFCICCLLLFDKLQLCIFYDILIYIDIQPFTILTTLAYNPTNCWRGCVHLAGQHFKIATKVTTLGLFIYIKFYNDLWIKLTCQPCKVE